MAAQGPNENKLPDQTKFVTDDGNKLRVTGILGQGAMGTVYSAQLEGSHERVAIKMLNAAKLTGVRDYDDVIKVQQKEHAQDIMIEAQVLEREGSLKGTVPLSENGVEYAKGLVTPIFPGRELKDIMYHAREETIEKLPMNMEDKNSFTVSALRELYALQSLNIIHRDIKPDNIMVDKESGSVKIIDFGTGKDNTNNDHEDRVAAAGIDYLAPECLPGEPEFKRGTPSNLLTDEYAMGVMLASMYSDQNFAQEVNDRPSTENSPHQILDDILGPNAEPKPGMPIELFTAIRHLCQRDPSQRAENVALAEGIMDSPLFKDVAAIQSKSSSLREGMLADAARRNMPDEIKQIIENHQDLSTIRNKMNNYLKVNPECSNDIKVFLQSSMKGIDKLGEINAHELQSARSGAIEYTSGIKSTVKSLGDLASTQRKTSGVKGMLSFSNQHAPLTESGRAIEAAKGMVQNLANYPKADPDQVSNILSQLSTTLTQQSASKSTIEKINVLSSRVEAIKPLAAAVAPIKPTENIRKKVRFQ